jgi:Ca2+-binding EF-hand superfamily protein
LISCCRHGHQVSASCYHALQIEKCREWDQWIENAFAAMDKSGRGRLSRDDLAAYLCKDGMCLSEQALRQALAEAHRACGDDMTLEVRQRCCYVQ